LGDGATVVVVIPAGDPEGGGEAVTPPVGDRRPHLLGVEGGHDEA
jgi:hypothetical protein